MAGDVGRLRAQPPYTSAGQRESVCELAVRVRRTGKRAVRPGERGLDGPPRGRGFENPDKSLQGLDLFLYVGGELSE